MANEQFLSGTLALKKPYQCLIKLAVAVMKALAVKSDI